MKKFFIILFCVGASMYAMDAQDIIAALDAQRNVDRYFSKTLSEVSVARMDIDRLAEKRGVDCYDAPISSSAFGPRKTVEKVPYAPCAQKYFDQNTEN